MNCWIISPNSCDAKVFCWVPILVGVTFARYTICTMMYRIGVTKGKELQEIMGYYQFIPLVMIVREGFLYPSTPRQRHRPLRTPGHVQLLRGGTWIWTMGTSRWDPDDLPTGTKHVPTWDFEALISSCFGTLMQPSHFSFWRYQDGKAMRTHTTFNEVSKFLLLKENDENDSGRVWNIPHSRFLLEKAVRPFALVMSSHVEVGWCCFNQTLKLRPEWNMLVCHMLTLFCIGKMCEVQKSSRWKFDAGPLRATLCGSSKSGTLPIEQTPEIGSWCFIPFRQLNGGAICPISRVSGIIFIHHIKIKIIQQSSNSHGKLIT